MPIQKKYTNPYLALLSIAWGYAKDQRGKYVATYALFIAASVCSALYPVIWGLFINALQQPNAQVLHTAALYAAAYLGLRLLFWAIHGPARVMERELAFHISKNFLQELYHKTLHLPVRWHQDHHSGATINRMRKAYEALRDFFQNGYEYLYSLLKFTFSFGAMIYFAPAFGLIAVALGVVVVWIIVRFDKSWIASQQQINEKEHTAISALFDSLSNIVSVIILRLEQRMEVGLIAKVMQILPPFKRNVVINEWKWFVTDTLVGVIYVVILLGYLWQNWRPGEVFLLGGLVMLIGYVEQFTSVFHNVAALYTNVVRQHTDVSMAFTILRAYDQRHLPEEDAPLPENWQTIRISHLHYRRKVNAEKDKQAPGLHDLNLTLRRGSRIALIGESGSGKSTLLALLRGLHTPEPGVEVLVDAHPHPGGIEGIMTHVTLFPQDPEIFENTIEYNITLGLPLDSAEIDLLCDTVYFSDVLKRLPHGLQSHIMEKGVNLSGGQKQRLALARGVFAAKDSDIVLLDEPTSSVDPKTEIKIYEKMFDLFADKVVVSTLHRLHLLRHFDYIYVMENGRISAEGTLDYLLTHSSLFQELWRHQKEHN